jgi:predicted transposase YdaD
MQTDQAIYQYLSTGPEAFRVLTGGMILSGPYEFQSVTLKSIERRIDAVFVPQDHAGPVYLVEFQAQWNAASWYNLLTKIGMYGEQHPHQDVQGILIFPKHADDAKKSHWAINALYLEDFLPGLLTKEPNNPYVTVFAPLILASDAELAQQAPNLWHTVHTAPLPDTVRTNLKQVLELWFFERFKGLNEQEVLAMLQTLTPLEETCAYKSIFAKGEARGKAEGEARGEARGIAKGKAEGKAEGQAAVLKRLITRRFGKLPKWAEKRIDKADTTQLETWAEAIFDARTIKDLLLL